MTKSPTEAELIERAVAPRVTLESLTGRIAAESYINVGKAADALGQPTTQAMHLTMLCILTMNNGYTVIGQSACASPENYQEDIGKSFAKEDAIRQCWPLLGFELRTQLTEWKDAN